GKRWQTRKGRTRGGAPFTKTSLYRLLTNVAYAGKVRYKDEVHPGEQPALIDADTFVRVQALLERSDEMMKMPCFSRFPFILSERSYAVTARRSVLPVVIRSPPCSRV